MSPNPFSGAVFPIILAQAAGPVPPDLQLQSWVATGGTYGLIVALLYAVRYLTKRDEKSTAALVTALDTKLGLATQALHDTEKALDAANSRVAALEGRIQTLEAALAHRCPFLGENDEEKVHSTAKAMAERLLREEMRRDGGARRQPEPPHGDGRG